MEKKLTFEEIKSCFLGAETLYEEEGSVKCCRFTPEEQEVYRSNPDFFNKSCSSSNMIISFFTDAEKAILEYEADTASSRRYAYVDVKVDGITVAHSGAGDVKENPANTIELPLSGKKCQVEFFLPPLASFTCKALTLVNGSFLGSARREKLIICYGDSITQGYDARFPLCAYTSHLAENFKAEVINKAIGGEFFIPALVRAGKKGRKVDLVTVAYGTNDWSRCAADVFAENCENFFAALAELYPETPVAVILPLWRKDHDRETLAGNFFEHREKIRTIAGKYPQNRFIDGLELTPHVEEFYSDAYLHPNDLGFMFMGQKVTEEIKRLFPAL